MTRKTQNNLTIIAVVLILAVAMFIFETQGKEQNRIGLELVMHYADGSSRKVDAPIFADVLSLQGMVWFETAQISSIDVNMLVQNTIQAYSMTYSCVYEVKFDSTIKRTRSTVVNVGSGSSVKYAVLTTVSASEILGWSGATNGTHTFEVNVPVGSSLVAQTSDGLKAFQYAGQRVTMSLTVDNDITGEPPVNPPPVNPPANQASITLYTMSWNTTLGVWQFQAGVNVAVAWTGGSGTWTTNADGYVTMNVTAPDTYTFSASAGGFTNSTSLTVAVGDVKSVTLYFMHG